MDLRVNLSMASRYLPSPGRYLKYIWLSTEDLESICMTLLITNGTRFAWYVHFPPLWPFVQTIMESLTLAR